MRSVLVTRPQPMADEFADILRRAGFRAYLAPMMEYVEIAADLGDLRSYQALVFTSAESVRIFARRSPERRLPVLAVGDATAATAEKAGFSQVYSAKGDGGDVMGLLRAKTDDLSLKKVLHPCSEDTPHDISAAAAHFDVRVVQRPLYKAHFIKKLPDEALWALQDGAIDTVTFFSARTAANLAHILKQERLRGVSARMRAVCISARVAAAAKEIPWAEVRVAARPAMDSMLEALKSLPDVEAAASKDSLPVESVILAFGGIQALAARLKITPSAVQGWRKRGVVPEIRASAVLRAAKEDGIDSARLYDRAAAAAAHHPVQKRKPHHAPRLREPSHEQRQQDRIIREKARFIRRAAITFVSVASVVTVAATLLLAPEYHQVKKALEGPAAAGGRMSAWVSAATETAAAPFRTEEATGLLKMLDSVTALRQTPDGDALMAQVMRSLRAGLAQAGGDTEIAQAVDAARRRDRALDSLLGQAGVRDIAAAAMLLALNEFRGNFYGHRPYAEDLALLQKFAGDDPEMSRALQRLAPYARKGLMSRETLQAEFGSLARDIVLARLQGEDISVKDEALARLERLAQAGSASEIRGRETEAVVARAQLLLNQGDVKGAVRELQALEGGAAVTADPWMDSASGYVMAGKASDDLTEALLGAASSGGGFSFENLFSSIKDIFRSPDAVYISPALKGGGGDYTGVTSLP